MGYQLKIKRHAPRYAAEPEERPVCTRYARCEGCPYPRHGFICWHSDGSCLRTDMEKIYKKRRDANDTA